MHSHQHHLAMIISSWSQEAFVQWVKVLAHCVKRPSITGRKACGASARTVLGSSHHNAQNCINARLARVLAHVQPFVYVHDLEMRHCASNEWAESEVNLSFLAGYKDNTAVDWFCHEMKQLRVSEL